MLYQLVPTTWVTYMVKLTIYLVSLAPRDNNYLIQNISQNNFAQASKERGLHIGARACTHDMTHDVGRKLPYFF